MKNIPCISWLESQVSGQRLGLLFLLAFSASMNSAIAADAPREIRGKVIEVKDVYCKIELPKGSKLKKGLRGSLLRESDSEKTVGRLTITAINDAYVVGKCSSGAPQLGDIAVFRITAGSSSSTTSTGPKKTRKQLLAEKRAKQEAAQAVIDAAERVKWLERLKVRGVSPWPELSDEEQEKALQAHKEMIVKVKKVFPSLSVYETHHFLFVSNMPPQQCKPYVLSLDNMYEMMREMYRLKKGTKVFQGKALVYAFLQKQEFAHFERTFMQHDPGPNTYGLCHSDSRGDVIIGCYRGDRPEDFGHMLVHETSHGFVARYRTPVRLPSWVNEGMAEYIGQTLVRASDSVKRKEKSAFEQMKQTRNLGGNFFATNKNIDGWQYGVASSMNDFLIRTNTKHYVDFIEKMKEGLTCEEACAQSFGGTLDQLVTAYGRAIGIPDLRP